jgi:uncharacterized phage-associated protein
MDTQTTTIKFIEFVQDEQKVKELILLFSELSEGDATFGATKLNKLLFFSDFLAYQIHGKSISGSKYEARPQGPMLKNFYAVQDEMQGNKEIAIRTSEYGGYRQNRTLALRTANLSQFSGEELEIVMRVLNEYRNMNASQISALSHEFLGWQAVDIGEEIPYEIALVSTRDLTPEEYEFPTKTKLNFEQLGINPSKLVMYGV